MRAKSSFAPRSRPKISRTGALRASPLAQAPPQFREDPSNTRFFGLLVGFFPDRRAAGALAAFSAAFGIGANDVANA